MSVYMSAGHELDEAAKETGLTRPHRSRKMQTKLTAVAGPVERGFRPVAWLITHPQQPDWKGSLWHNEPTAADRVQWGLDENVIAPLYDQAALDAALNLWPRDCRLCAHFRDGLTHAAHCVSVLRCKDSSAYRATQPVQFWEKRPAEPAPF